MSLRRLAPFALAVFVALPAAAQEADAPPAGAPIESPDGETAEAKVPLDEIRRYVSVYNAVKQAYVEPVADQKLMHSAIRGLLFDLDPHSVYLDKEDAESFDEQSRGAYDGVGFRVAREESPAPSPASPARSQDACGSPASLGTPTGG